VVEFRERAVGDAELPEAGEESPAQVERELVMRVEQILHFSQGPHSDVSECDG
jgi:hypothetical protein